MQKAETAIRQLAEIYLGQPPNRMDAIPQSGSNRVYYRIYHGDKTLIGTYNNHLRENQTFIYFTRHFGQKNLPVSTIVAVSDDGFCYLQSDLGTQSLMQVLEANGQTEGVKQLFKDSLDALARLQVLGHQSLDYSQCITAKEFGRQAILSDLLYFKYYFLDTLHEPYDKQAMLDDFDALATYLARTEYKFFMFRDFQSRNIIIREGAPYFIDYQGGMLGAPQYDAASMIWQARAQLPDDWKRELFASYVASLEKTLNKPIDKIAFEAQYYGYVLIRLLQVLGAYGFRGLFERKAQFLSSIPQALRNLKWFVNNRPLAIHVPEFKRMLQMVVSEELILRFTPPKANADTPLVVALNSFSFLKNGYPVDDSSHGGGFVFDCRGILNPGRVEEFKKQSGIDKEVIDFLEQKTRMPEFLNSVFDLIDISVEDYMKRGFEKLTINFGCTGGQHRSVYAAEQTARHLRNKYNLKTEVNHLNRENWVR